jgi:ribosomal protein L16/L10AE
MLGKRFKKGFISALKIKKWKKAFSKVYITGKKFFFINSNISKSLLTNISFSKFKTRQYYIRNLDKKQLYKKFKNNFLNKSSVMLVNPFLFLFKNYTVSCIVSQNYGKISDFHLEMIRKTIKKTLSKKALIFLRLKPYLIMLKRSAQVRMGGGKASKFSMIYYPVVPGSVIFEIYGLTYKSSFNAFKTLNAKLPVKLKMFFTNVV